MLHVTAAILLSPAVCHRAAGDAGPRIRVEDEIAIELETSNPLTPTVTPTLTPPPTRTSTAPSTASGTLAFATSLSPTSTRTATASEAPAPIASADDSDWSFASSTQSTLQRDVLGVTSHALAPTKDSPPPPSDVTSRRPSTNGGLVDGLDARDRELGLGRGGPVLSAVEEAARMPGETPPEGSADYEVVVRRSGGVNVALLSSNDSRASWEAIMKDIERGVSARSVRLPESAAGMRFVVHVDAVVQWPDGKRPAKMGTQKIATTGEVGSSESHPGLDFTRVPMVGVYHAGKVCSAGIALTPGMVMVGGACSPENIGQPAARIVHGRVLSESRL